MHVVPICLSDDDNLLVGEKAWVKGFGRIGASKLGHLKNIYLGRL